MPEALKAKQFGLPRWVWLLALTGGVIGGLYIRSRRAEAEAEAEYDEDELALGEDSVGAGFGEAEYNGLDGLPVGFYDAVSGAGDYLPDPVGDDTTSPIINIYTSEGPVQRKPKPPVKRPSAKKKKPKVKRPKTGGGPPKRPAPVRPKPPKKKAPSTPPKKKSKGKAKGPKRKVY